MALLLGIAAGLFAAWNTFGDSADFRAWWQASRLWMDGVDPYRVPLSSTAWPWPDPLFYPGPAVLLAVPFGWLPLPAAAGLFIGTTSAALAWVLSASGWWRLWFFASPAFIMAVELGQWSPAICLAALVPALGWLAAAKPNLGAAVLGWRLSPTAIALAIALALLSVAVMPQWPGEWMANLAKLETHPAPLFTPSGCWLLIALLRWRRAALGRALRNGAAGGGLWGGPSLQAVAAGQGVQRVCCWWHETRGWPTTEPSGARPPSQ